MSSLGERLKSRYHAAINGQGMTMKFLIAAAVLIGGLLASTLGSFAQDYVRVCYSYGIDYFYSPGTDTCINANTQETRRDTEFGTVTGKTAFAASVDARIAEAFESAAIANALADPDLVAGEHFGLKINWGGVESANAFGLTGAVVSAKVCSTAETAG